MSTWLKEFPPFQNIMYAYVVHAQRVGHCNSKTTDLCLYIYINSCYDIFTVIQYFLLKSKLNSLSAVYLNNQI